MPGKKTVNVTRFLTDFRSGASDADLMTRHGIDRRGLQKMLRVLEERQLVPAEDLKRDRYASPEEPQGQATSPTPPPVPDRESHASDTHDEKDTDAQSTCPQCGARVTEKMLTCPECGHVLPGETRWSRVQPERSARFRLPPWLIGCIIACPIALGLYALFKHVLVPMSTASIHMRSHAVGKPLPSKHGTSRATGNPEPAVSPIDEQVQCLTGKGMLLRVGADYAIFTVSDLWYHLSREEKIGFVTELGSALLASGVNTPFEVRDDSGILGARVNIQAIELLDRYGYSETIARTDTDDTQQQPTEN